MCFDTQNKMLRRAEDDLMFRDHSVPPPILILKINMVYLKLYRYFPCYLRDFIVANDRNTHFFKLEYTKEAMID